MNIFADFDARIKKALQALELKTIDGADVDLSRVGVEPPRDPSHGDIATNAAMVLSKAVGQNPRELAIKIGDALKNDPDVGSVDVAGPGFINLRLKDTYWHGQLAGMLGAGLDYGRSKLGYGHRVNVEFVSANPTGPMHVGHCRGAVVGDALANLLSFAGYDVTKEYYINDAGAQIDVLANSVMLRYREAHLLFQAGKTVRGLAMMTAAFERASKQDRVWIGDIQEQAFSIANEADRRTAIVLAEDIIKTGDF